MPLYASRFTGIEEFSPDGLLRRHGAIDVPVACAAGFEKFFVIASKLAGACPALSS
jgi:hypothetical protein